MFIYRITNKINGKVYIGKTVRSIDARWTQHLADVRRGSDLLFHRAIRKYGADEFLVEVLYATEDFDELNRLECAAIQQHRSYERDYGYNLTLGGDGSSPGELNPMFGKTHTPEARELIRLAHLGTNQSEETKIKISEASRGSNNPFYGKTHTSERALEGCRKGGRTHIGKKRSLETKEKISTAARGKPKSLAHCQAISAAKKGKPGHTPSEESRQRMSESRREWWAARKGL